MYKKIKHPGKTFTFDGNEKPNIFYIFHKPYIMVETKMFTPTLVYILQKNKN